MKYSLRSLMIVVTIAAVVLGGWAGRVDYLRRWSAYHSSEYHHLIKSLAAEQNEPENRIEAFCEMFADEPVSPWYTARDANREPHPYAPAMRHKRLAKVYQQASYKPWALVDEGKP